MATLSHNLDMEKASPSDDHVEDIVGHHHRGGLSEEDAEFMHGFSEERRKRVVRKIDWRLVPFLGVLYLLGYLDRANIGNAKIEGMLDDLNMTGKQYNIAVSIFFVTYIAFELPSNAILAQARKPSWYIGSIVMAWGVVMTLTGLVKNFQGLCAARVMLGLAEAGFFPGAIYTVSQWYVPGETQFRISLFYCASALSGAFSGLLAFAIAKMDGVGGLEGWRWIFIIEGMASVLAGVLCFNLLLDTPALSGKWLDQDEIRYLQLRQLVSSGTTNQIRDLEKPRRWSILRTVFLDWHLYCLILMYWSNSAPNYGLKLSMPQIIQSMGYTSSDAQLLTIPPYTAGAITSLLSGLYADKMRWRMPFIAAPLALVIIAYAVLYSKAADISNNIGVCYFAVCLACAGLYPVIPGANTWTVTNLAGPTKKAYGSAYMIALGNIGGIIGSYMYMDAEAPSYPTGYGLSLAFASLGIVAALVLEYGLWRTNKKKESVSANEVRDRYNAEELALMGDRSPLFRYTL